MTIVCSNHKMMQKSWREVENKHSSNQHNGIISAMHLKLPWRQMNIVSILYMYTRIERCIVLIVSTPPTICKTFYIEKLMKMAKESKTPQYAAKQLRLTNEEIVEKFAVYWAEVDWVARRLQSSDRMMETIMANQSKIQKDAKELKKNQEILALLLILLTIVTWIWFRLVTR